MTLMRLAGLAIVVFIVVFIIGAMMIGYVVENRTGADYVLLGAIVGALLVSLLHSG